MRKGLLTELMMAAPYEPATNYWRAIEVEEVIRHSLPEGRGVDLGCGDGHLMSIILGHLGARDLVGVDIDPRETITAAGRKVYREIITAAGDHLPFPDNQFDFIFSNSVLEHITAIDSTLVEVARVLRAGARFIYTVPGPEFHSCLRGPNVGNRESYLRLVDERCAHLRYWSVSEWNDHLRRARLTLVHQHGYLSEAQVRRWETLARYTSGILYSIVRRKKQPIDLQRQFAMRSGGVRLPRPVAYLAAGALDFGVPDGTPRCGCLLMEAQKI